MPDITQGVTCNGSQKLDLGGIVSGAIDTPNSIFFASYDPADGRNALLHWGNVNSSGHYGTDNVNSDNLINPVSKFQFTTSGDFGGGATTFAPLGRIQLLVATERVNTNDIKITQSVWSASTGWTSDSWTRPGAGDVSFLSEGDNLILLKKRNNAAGVVGDVYRLALWIGTTADVTDPAIRNLFSNGEIAVDAATSVASLGDTNRVLDAYGDANAWETGTFPKGGPFTKTGDAFVGVGSSGVSGTLNVQETGSDIPFVNGTVETVTATGSVSAQESGNDVANISGDVIVSGSSSIQETGEDSPSVTGAVEVSGTVSAQEPSQDTAVLTGTVSVVGSLSVQETGSDVFSGSGVQSITGSLSAQELGSDGASFILAVTASAALNVQESGSDTATFVGTVPAEAILVVQETGSDSFRAFETPQAALEETIEFKFTAAWKSHKYVANWASHSYPVLWRNS